MPWKEPKADYGPFSAYEAPGEDVSAAAILMWVAKQLDDIPARADYKWRIWLGKLAYQKVKEEFWPFIELKQFGDQILIHSPNKKDWSMWITIGGWMCGHEDSSDDVELDEIRIELEIHDGTMPGMA